jgi:ABC-2 type transport system permease protein
MWHDLYTMMWKEWKELFTSRSAGRGTLLSTLVILFVLGVFMPLQSGADWFTQPLTVVVWAWMPIFLTLGMVTDSFAGERERHTLETLLATRLPDTAILLGKILAAVLYGWGIAVVSLLVAALTLNLSLKGGPYFYAPEFFAAALGFSLLSTVLFAGLGVLASLRAATARQAYQRLSLILLVFYFLPFMIQFLPADLRTRILEALLRLDWRGMMLALGGVLLVLDVGVLGVCFRRFQRSRLLLD